MKPSTLIQSSLPLMQCINHHPHLLNKINFAKPTDGAIMKRQIARVTANVTPAAVMAT
jgi:hypothetical protein